MNLDETLNYRTVQHGSVADRDIRGAIKQVSKIGSGFSRRRTSRSKNHCCVCDNPSGISIQCTGPCKLHFHLPDEQNFSCNPLSVDPEFSKLLLKAQRSFLCPLCWNRTRAGCRSCGKISEFPLKKCDVTVCPYHFCQSCISEFQNEAIFDGVFICPNHYCCKCRSLVPVNNTDSKLIHCPVCSRSVHCVCLDQTSCTVLTQEVVLCEHHGLSIDQYWTQLITQWKRHLLVEDQSSNPNKRVCCEDVIGLSSVLGPKSGLHEMIRDVYKDEWSRLDPEELEMTVYPPYDTIPTIPSDEKIRAFHERMQFPQHTNQNDFARCANTLKRYRENLRVYLNPLLQRTRYTSYGRHFSNSDILRTVAQLTVCLIADGDQLVDMTCGRNEFIPIIKELLPNSQINGRAYDIITPLNEDDWIRKSWFDVEKSELQSGDHLVIGLNPPFGKNGALAETFLIKATEFSPRFVVFIAPKGVRTQPGYQLIYDNPVLCKDYAFFTQNGGQSWSSDPPTLRIYHRVDPPCEAKLNFANPAMLASLFPSMREFYPSIWHHERNQAAQKRQKVKIESGLQAPHQIEME